MERFVSSCNKPRYQANGFIKGLYLPENGVIRVDDSEEFKIRFSPIAQAWLKKHPEALKAPQLFHVYPRCVGDSLAFYAIAVMTTTPSKGLTDWFCIRGELSFWKQSEKLLQIKINRNDSSTRSSRPFFLNIRGQLPCKKRKGEFWEMRCVREGEVLILSDAIKIVQPKPQQSQRLHTA